jgi:hypothetical protein
MDSAAGCRAQYICRLVSLKPKQAEFTDRCSRDIPQPGQPPRHRPVSQPFPPNKESVSNTLCDSPCQQNPCISILPSIYTRKRLLPHSQHATPDDGLGKQAHNAPDQQHAARNLHSCCPWTRSHDAHERVQNLQDGDRLSESEERVKCFVESIQVAMGEKNRDEEYGSEGCDAPKYKAYPVIRKKVVLP